MSKSSKKKFYVVWKGRQPGIYETWTACEAQVKGFPGAAFKAFPTRAMAEAAWQQGYETYRGKPVLSQQWLFAPNPPVTPCVCVDAACAGVPGPVEYQGVHLPDERLLFRQGPFPDGTNNIGEFLAIVHALAWLEQNGLDEPVYSDSRTAIAWVRKGRCGTEHQLPAGNRLADLVARAETWLAAHPAAVERVRKWDTETWGEIPADFGRK